MISVIFPLAAFALLVVLAFCHLRAAEYSHRSSIILVALLSAQLAVGFSAGAFHALLLALVLSVTAKAAMEFATAQSARGVIALGLLLAAVQIVSPAGLMVSAVVVPVLAATPAASRRKNTGLLLLLLFTPMTSAVVFAYLAWEFQFDLSAYIASPLDHLLCPQIFDRMNPRRSGLINAIALVAAAVPIWWLAARSRRAGFVAVIASALVVAVAVAALMQRSYSFGTFVPALGELSLLAIAELESSPHRARRAIAILTASVTVSWLFLMASP